jgi:hypothetical protein
MRLALRLGRTLRELLATIESSELTLWQAFDDLEPIGGDADDYRAALAAAVTFNVNRGPNTPVKHPLDLIPWSSRHRPIVLGDDETVEAFDRLIGLN